MKEAGEQFERMLGSSVSSQAPAVPFFSSQTNEVIQHKKALDAAYWRSSYDSPVLFHTAVETLLAMRSSSNPPLLLEIGPHSALAGPIRQILKGVQSDAFYVPTLVRNENDTHSMLTAAGQLFLKGLQLDFRALNPDGQVLTNLPRYPWRHKTRYWYESRLSKQWRLRTFPRHDLLGSRVPECSDLEPVWRNILRLDDVPWCHDHVIAGDTVFPGAGYIAMAGEAIRQISGSEAQDFTLRDFSLNAAMILHDSTATETMFAMRPFRLTTSLDSVWYEFTIMSYNGTTGTWTKHCAGQVRAGSQHPVERRNVVDLPRKVQSSSWYRLMRKVGMGYGPHFQALDDISAHPIHYSAIAHVANTISEAESVYQLHPTMIDGCIQLFTVAACRGQARSFRNVPLVPTRFGEVYVKRPRAKVAVEVNAEFNLKGGIDGSCFGIAENEPVLLLKNVKLSPLGDGDFPRDKDPYAGVCVQWKPDIAFQQISSLISSAAPTFEDAFPTLQRLMMLCSIEARNRLTGLSTPVKHMSKFFTWLHAEVARAVANQCPSGDNVEEFLSLSSSERVDLIAGTAARLSETKVAAVGIAVCRIFDAVEGIFCGEVEPLELLQKDDLLTQVHMLTESVWNCRPFLQLLSHSKPHLRILEIGGGIGAITKTVLDCLMSEFGERMFYSYTFTDISPDVLDTAKETFVNVQGMEFLPLNISHNPAKQGFAPRSFDLVIVTNVSDGFKSLEELFFADIEFSTRSYRASPTLTRHLPIYGSFCTPTVSFFCGSYVRTQRGSTSSM